MNIKEALAKKILEISLSPDEEGEVLKLTSELIGRINSKIKKHKAECILGGSFSKGTAIKKDKYDVDIFAVFSKKFEAKKLSDCVEKALKEAKLDYRRVPGSRDYFKVKVSEGKVGFNAEIVPVVAIEKSEEAQNITDVSLLHVKYVNGKIKKNGKLRDEIKLAKAFCYAQECYGAESHIKGFSGYCLEILTVYFGGFANLAKEASKWYGKDKIIIDPEKYYKDKSKIMEEINESKLMSPLILIDPVQKSRNVAAAVSMEKFEFFSSACRKFIAKPSLRHFEKKEFNEGSLISEAKRSKKALFRVHAISKKIKEDISGAKLLKLHNLMGLKLKEEHYKFKSHWDFKEKSSNSYFLIQKEPGRVILDGPPEERKEHAKAFKKKWKNWKMKKGKLFAERKPKKVGELIAIDKKTLKEMGINSFKITKMD